MQRLVQTTFAAAFTQREESAGRYSPALHELVDPGDFVVKDELESDEPLRFETQLVTPLRLPLPKPGFAKSLPTFGFRPQAGIFVALWHPTTGARKRSRSKPSLGGVSLTNSFGALVCINL